MKDKYLIRMRSRTLIALAVLSAVSAPAAYAGAPLKGVDVKLGKNPGGQVALRTTDSGGKATFGILSKGSYSLALAAPRAAASDSAPKTAKGASSPSEADARTCTVTVEGAGREPMTLEWNVQTNAISDTSRAASAKARPMDRIVFDSDGVHPVSVVVRSKSNISNN